MMEHLAPPNPRALHGPLHRFSFAHTSLTDEARVALVDGLGARSVDFRGRAQSFKFDGGRLRLKNLDLIFGSCTAAIAKKYPVFDQVRQQFAVRGSGRSSFRGSHYCIDRNETCVIPAGIETSHENSDACAQLVIRIDARALQNALGAQLGTPVVRNIEFQVPSSFGNPELARLRRLIEFLIAELDRDGSNVPTHMLAEFEQMLMASFLTANRHNFSGLLEREEPHAAPWQVRVVEEYIDAHWKEPITIQALATASGGSARSIFKTFRDTRGSSPMAFVKSVRLRHARHMLLAADRSTTVVAVAFACGFLNPGHFARDYRVAFGELPSATLAGAKQRRK
jgi:AraC-like DNA-binding protein